MAKMSTTRDAIIDEGLSQAVVFGLDGISIGGLASSLNLSKSGLFAHFKSKEALQLAVLDEAIERFARQVVAPALKAATPIQKLDRLFLGYLDWIRGDRQTGGCLFITAIQEFDERPGPVRDRLVASQMAWRETLEGAAREAIAAGELSPKPGPNVFVFELIGIALAYQHSQKLFRDRQARALAEKAFAHLKA
jgi:AcrR family transcriptional regulator